MTTLVVTQKTISAANGGFSGFNERLVIPVASLDNSYTGTGLISVNIQSFSTHNGTLDAIWIGHQGAGNVYNFDGNQVQLFFGGSASLTWSGASTHTTDTAAFNYDPTKALIVSTHWSGTTDTGASAAGPTNCNQFLSGASQVSVTNPTGVWSQDSTWTWVAEIDLVETAIAAGSPVPRYVSYRAAVLGSTTEAVGPLFIPPVIAPPVGFDLVVQEDLPRRADYSRTLESTTHPVLPPTPPVAAQTPAFSFFHAIEEELPRRRDYRVVLTDTTEPVTGLAFRTAVTPASEVDLSLQEDLPRRRNYFSALDTTQPVLPVFLQPPLIGCQLGIASDAGRDALGVTNGNVLGVQCLPAAATPSDLPKLVVQEDLPRRADYYRALESTTHPVLGRPQAPAQTPAFAFFHGGEEDRPRRPDYRTVLATSPVEPFPGPQATPTPAVMAKLVGQEDLPRRPDYFRALETTTHSVIPAQAPAAAQTPVFSFFHAGEEDRPRRPDYRAVLATQPVMVLNYQMAATPSAEFDLSLQEDLPRRPDYSKAQATTQPVLPVFIQVGTATPNFSFFPAIKEDNPRRPDYRTALVDTTRPVVPYAFRVAATPTTDFDLSLEDDLPRRRDYQAVLASSSQPVLPVFVPAPLLGCQLGLHNSNDILGLHNAVDVLGIPCLPNAVTPGPMANLVVQEQRLITKDYRTTLGAYPAIPPVPPVAAQVPKFLFKLVVQEDLPRRRDYRAALAGVVVQPRRAIPPFSGCELALISGSATDTLGLSTHNPADTLAAACPTTAPTPSIMTNLARGEDLPRRKNYTQALIASGPRWQPVPGAAIFTPTRWFDPPSSPMPRAYMGKNYRIVLMNGPVLDPKVTAGVVPPPPPHTCVVTLGDNNQTATVTFIPSGVSVAVVIPTGPGGTPVALTPATANQIVSLAAATAGVVIFDPNIGCPVTQEQSSSDDSIGLDELGLVVAGDFLALIDGINILGAL